MSLRRLPREGFSLMELMVVVVILGVLATIIVPRITVTATTAEARADEHNRAQINSAVERYQLAEETWPTDLGDLDGHADYFPDGVPDSPVTSLPYTLNATTHRVD